MIKEGVQRVQIQVFKFKSLFFLSFWRKIYREAIYCSWTPEVKPLSSPCLVPAGHARGRCLSRPAESLKSAKLVRPLFLLQMGFIDKWQIQSAGVLSYRHASVGHYHYLITLLSGYVKAAENVKQLCRTSCSHLHPQSASLWWLLRCCRTYIFHSV